MQPDTSAHPAYSVLVGVDYSKESARALAEAVELARHHAGSRIHALHAVPSVPLPVPAPGVPDLITTGPAPFTRLASEGQITPEMSRDLEGFVEETLEQATAESERGVAQPSIPWTPHVRLSEPAEAIVELAAELGVNVIVVGTHARHGLERLLLGSVAEAVVRHAPCPVLVVPPAHHAATSASR